MASPQDSVQEVKDQHQPYQKVYVYRYSQPLANLNAEQLQQSVPRQDALEST